VPRGRFTPCEDRCSRANSKPSKSESTLIWQGRDHSKQACSKVWRPACRTGDPWEQKGLLCGSGQVFNSTLQSLRGNNDNLPLPAFLGQAGVYLGQGLPSLTALPGITYPSKYWACGKHGREQGARGRRAIFTHTPTYTKMLT